MAGEGHEELRAKATNIIMVQHADKYKKLITCIWIVLSFLVFFIVVYFPVIQRGYFYLDDYAYFTPDKPSLSFFMQDSFLEGRFFEGRFLYLLSNMIQSTETTKVIRLIGIFGIALLASVMYAVFKQSRFRSDQAFLISALICTLPFMQIFASWMIVIPSIYSALLSALSALILFQVVFDEVKEGTHTVIGLLTAIILLVVALCINQPPAMMYWAMGVSYFLAKDYSCYSKKEYRQQIIRYFIVGFSSMAIYFIIFMKLIPFIMNISMYRSALVPIRLIPHQIKWFIFGPLIRTLNLWNDNPTYLFAACIGIIIIAGFILNYIQAIKEKTQICAIDYVIKYILILFIVILSFLPKLIVTEPTYYLRTLVTFAAAISILFFFGIDNIMAFFKFIPNFSTGLRETIVTVLLVILTVGSAFSAYNNVNNMATRFSTELQYMKNTIKDYGISNLLKVSKIYIRRSRPWAPPMDDSFNEFKTASTTSAEQGMILFVVKRALYDLGIKDNIQITHGSYDETVQEDNSILIIDLMKVDKFNRFR